MLSDGTFGQVESQSVENVVVKLKGGSIKSYQVPDYLALHPEVLSYGFRINSILGLDYSHISIASHEMLEILKEGLGTGLVAANYSRDNFEISIEFSSLSNSSLDIAMIVDFDGKYAPDYQKLSRLLQKLALEISVRNNWQIPFPQMTVHWNKGGD